ncbi:hypothetical protein [Ruminococcus sp.]|uniref:hypothetical protein n=1 Tax=Ruminococcus sp. TaxID=41978 RepID=UPI0025D8B420|nr:hypothetical protein [Ruminococcus sp.]MBQ6252475.1 hypothetical protein [Ruminococcus sp.]
MINSMVLLAASTDPLGDLVGIVLWIARTLLLIIGGGGGLIMIVKGKTDENPKFIYEGLGAIAGAGVMFAATFAVASIFK